MIDTFSIRCSILRLAFSGKLTEQSESEGNAKNLLSRIAAKKDIEQTENTPHEIPASWAWARLADVYKINPKVEADDSAEAAFIPMERISAGFDGAFTFETQSWGRASKNHTKFQDGDVAFAKITPCFENRKSFIAHGLPNGIGGGTTELIILRQSEMLPEYTYYLLLDQRFISAGKASYKGTVGQQRVQSEVIKNYLVPVPPYQEQQRIVEKIGQAFSELDTIDALQARHAGNLAALRAKLIDAAIRGQLTEQLPQDGTAEELYQQIQAEKQALIKAGKIRKEKPLPEVTPKEAPFDIPANWKWVKLGNIARVLGGKRIPVGRSLTKEDTGHKYIRVSDMKNRTVQTDNLLFVPEDIFPSISQYIINKQDVYITVAGTIGRVGKIPPEIDGANLTENADRIVFSHIDQDWLITCLSATAIQKQIELLTTSVAQPKLAIKRIQEFLIPLAPLAEQRRIVARLDEVLKVLEA